MGAEVVALLAPLLPVLLSRAADALSHARRRHGAKEVEAAEQFWKLLLPHLSRNQLLASALEQLARRPDDEEARRLVALNLDALFRKEREVADAAVQFVQVGRDAISAGQGAAISTGGGVAASGQATAVGRDYYRYGAADPWARVRASTGPRRVMIFGGLSVSLIGFALFMVSIFSAFGRDSPNFLLVGVGFALFGAGGILAGIASEAFGPRE